MLRRYENINDINKTSLAYNMLSKYKFKNNPFRTVLSFNQEELIWAGFPEIREKFEKRIKRSIRIPNSTIVLNWGEYGSGKTHAARYFSKQSVLQTCIDPEKNSTTPLSIVINFPKGKNVVRELFTQIIDKIDIATVNSKLSSLDSETILNNVTDNMYVRQIISYLFREDFEKDLYLKYLYDESSTQERNKLGFLRKIETDNDIVELLSALLTVITDDTIYPCVIIWIDEFEDIAYQSSSNINNINNFIKVLFDKTPNKLLLFINFTLSAMANVGDLSVYLQDAVKSRIKERIELAIPDKDELKIYLIDLLNNPINRDGKPDGYVPFEEDMIDQLIDDIGNTSLRRFNEALSYLLESADLDGKSNISKEYYLSIKDEIIGWKDE